MKEQTTGRPRTVSGPNVTGRFDRTLVPTLLLADADEDACAMVRDALLEGVGPADLRTVASADALDRYLHRRPPHDSPVTAPAPALIVLDRDLPERGALDAVRAIRSNDAYRRTPVVVLARYLVPEQTAELYDAGVNTVIPKPVTFLALVKLMKVFTAYWLEAADLPPEPA